MIIKEEALLEALRSTIADIGKDNPIGRISSLDRIVDLGPCYSELSPDMQRGARGDWLDAKFLTDWVARLKTVEVLSAKDPRYADVLALL